VSKQPFDSVPVTDGCAVAVTNGAAVPVTNGAAVPVADGVVVPIEQLQESFPSLWYVSIADLKTQY